MPSETVSEGIAFVPPFLHHGQCGPVDSSSRFSYPKKNGFPAINRHGSKPVAIPVPTSLPRLSPQAEKSGRQFAPLFLSEKNGFPAINRHGSKPVAIPVQTSPPPHNQRLTLFRLNFYAPYFLSADSDFFPFLTKRFSGDGFSLFLVGKHQEKHALQTKNDNGHFSVTVSAGQTFPGTLHPVNRIRHPVAAFSRQGANPGHSRRKRGPLQIILPRRHIGKKNSPSLANGEFSDNPEIYHGSLYSRAGSFRRSRFVAPVFSQKLRRVPFN